MVLPIVLTHPPTRPTAPVQGVLWLPTRRSGLMPALPECSAHDDCPRAAFLLLRDLPVCRVGFDELGGVL